MTWRSLQGEVVVALRAAGVAEPEAEARRIVAEAAGCSPAELVLIGGDEPTTLPAAPGYIGTFDTPGIKTLETFGVDPSIAASFWTFDVTACSAAARASEASVSNRLRSLSSSVFACFMPLPT